jgi:hypothetical protein
MAPEAIRLPEACQVVPALGALLADGRSVTFGRLVIFGARALTWDNRREHALAPLQAFPRREV